MKTKPLTSCEKAVVANSGHVERISSRRENSSSGESETGVRDEKREEWSRSICGGQVRRRRTRNSSCGSLREFGRIMASEVALNSLAQRRFFFLVQEEQEVEGLESNSCDVHYCNNEERLILLEFSWVLFGTSVYLGI